MSRDTYEPQTLASHDFAQQYSEVFDAYIELRVSGMPPSLAVIDAFGLIRNGCDLRNVELLGHAAEVNPYVKARFNAALESKKIKQDLWSQHTAVHELLKLIRNPAVRDTTRLNAISQLNVLCGYATLDEATSRKIGHTLADFYAMSTQQPSGEQKPH